MDASEAEGVLRFLRDAMIALEQAVWCDASDRAGDLFPLIEEAMVSVAKAASAVADREEAQD